jgi:hypothetical protein
MRAIDRVIIYRCAVIAAALTGALALASPAQAAFGVQPGSFESSLLDGTGTVVNPSQAGAHPHSQQVSFEFNTHPSPSGPGPNPDGEVKDSITELPAGLVGNPQAIPICQQADFLPDRLFLPSHCPSDSQIGVATVSIGPGSGFPLPGFEFPIFNLAPPKGVIARLGFLAPVPVLLDISVRTNGDYGLNATALSISESVNIYSTRVTLWGVPADPSHDPERWITSSFARGTPSDQPRRPFLSNPTRCGVDLPTYFRVDSWQDPGNFLSYTSEPMAFVGCNQLQFEPTIEAKPTTTLADAPSGIDFRLHIPQNKDVEEHEDPDGLVSSHLRDAVVTLPEGLTVNPPSAAVLDACSLEQIGMSAAGVANGDPIACPDASILGKAEVVTPALDHVLPGRIYLARQDENPFGSLLAMYLVIDDPESGLFLKLPGKIEPAPDTGRLTVSFRNNPQQPVEDLRLSFFGGPHAALKTPASCGQHTTTSSLTPWTYPEGSIATPSSSFTLTNGPDGGACPKVGAEAPHQFAFVAGTADPTAKAFSPFSLKLSRADGTQQLGSLEATLPKGLIGKLAGIPYCSDAALAEAARKSGKGEQASSSCPIASRVGSVDVGAGAGSSPLYVSGSAYLAGPYKGAPLSLAVVTPAVAGPFDLGTVVVRNALYVDPETAKIHAVSDPLPTILHGIPLDLRSVAIKIDRPDFILNPTDCDPLAVTGSATSVFGQGAGLSSPFQADECGALGFKPSLKLSLEGGTRRSDHPALRAVLKARSGDANIARTVVALPHSEFLAQENIRTICTRVQFNAGAGHGAECPKASIYGRATATTPLLDRPLSGPVFLRSSSNPLPDLVAALHGQIDIALVGRIDSKDGGIRTTFDSVPDAPVSKFVLRMQGGKKGLLANSRNLCRRTHRASVQMDAQNNKTRDLSPVLNVRCNKAAKGTKKQHRH